MFSKRENKEALAGGKGVACEGRSEVSHTAKVCTDEQVESEGVFFKKFLIRHIGGIYERVSKHIFAKPKHVIILIYVDVTGID